MEIRVKNILSIFKLKFYFKSLIIALIPILSINLVSQDTLYLKDAVKIALKNNFEIIISELESELSKNNNTSGNAGMMPNVNLYAGSNYSLTNSHLEYSSGTVTDKSNASTINYNAGIALNWTIFDGYKMFTTKEKLQELQNAGEIKLKAQIQQSLTQLYSIYYDIVKQKQILNAIREIKALSMQRLVLSETRFKAGISAKTDFLQAQIDYNTQSQNEIVQENLITDSKRKLSTILAISFDKKFEIDENIAIEKFDKSYYENLILDKNPSLQLLKKQIQIAELSKNEIESLNLPYLNLTAAYGLNLSDNSTGLVAINRNFGPSIGLTLNYPLYQGGNINRQKENYSITRGYLIRQLSAIQNQILNQFESYYSSYKTYFKMLEIESKTVDLAKENLLLSIERLKVSQTTVLEVRDAQVSYENSLTRKSNLNYNLKIAETQMKMLAGDL
jgi:outer membrane protein